MGMTGSVETIEFSFTFSTCHLKCSLNVLWIQPRVQIIITMFLARERGSHCVSATLALGPEFLLEGSLRNR